MERNSKRLRLNTAIRLLGRTAILSLAVGCVQAHAQQLEEAQPSSDAVASQGPAQGTDDYEQPAIVVTAQRREQSLQEVPLSVSVLSNDALGVVGTDNLARIEVAVPGLSITTQRANITPYLRGVGTQNAVVGEEGTVPVYVDGILMTSLLGAAISLPNVERVEVLKGPQGTLFGRNSIGGLINVVTRRPQSTFRTEGRISYDNFQTATIAAYVTGPITDAALADLSVYRSDQGEGWGHNLTLGNEVNKRDELSIRSKILLLPAGPLEVTLTADYSSRDTGLGPTRSILPGTVAFGGFPARGSIYDTQSQVRGSNVQSLDQWGVSARVEYDLGDATLTSTTSYRDVEGELYFDQDAVPLRIIEAEQIEGSETFQQELLITGSSGQLDFTAGLYYLRSDASFDYSIVSDFLRPNNQTGTSVQRTRAYSAFGQLEYEITNGTTLTGGLRYTKEKREFESTVFALPGFPFAPPGAQIGRIDPDTDDAARLSFGRLTWRAGVDHKIGRDFLVYGNYSRGFKSGVFNPANPFQPAVRPETLDSYEVGIKSELFKHVIFNISAFHYDYSNIQLVRATAGPPEILNATTGNINGVDAEVTYASSVGPGRLNIRAAASYLDAKYGEFPSGPVTIPAPGGGNIQTTGDITGRDMVRAAPLTFSVDGTYRLPVAAGSMVLSAAYYYNDGFYWEPDNRIKQDSYSIVNASLMRYGQEEKWGVGVFCNNCTDTKYFSQVSGAALGDLASPASPATYGVLARFKFGR